MPACRLRGPIDQGCVAHARRGPLRCQEVLYEPHLIWMSEGRFTLAGFERVQVEGTTINYAQSWLCTVEPGVP